MPKTNENDIGKCLLGGFGVPCPLLPGLGRPLIKRIDTKKKENRECWRGVFYPAKNPPVAPSPSPLRLNLKLRCGN